MKRFLFAVMAALLFLAGCTKKEEPPPPPSAAVVKPPPPEEPPPLEPGIEFADPAKQQRYEAHFREYITQFESPVGGSPIWLKMRDGRRVGGRLDGVGSDFVTIYSTGAVTRIAAADLAMESRAQLFLADFARVHAVDQVNREVAASPAVAKTNQLSRYPLFDDIVCRTGPGREFLRVGKKSFTRGKPIVVTAEHEDWIQVSLDSTNAVWIPRFVTYDINELDLAGRRRDLEILQSLDIVHEVKAEDNEAAVNFGAWDLFDSDIHEGIARTLAAYCATVRKSNLIFVTVRAADNAQGQMGKYTQSRGWEEKER